MPGDTSQVYADLFARPARLPLAGARRATERCGWRPSLRPPAQRTRLEGASADVRAEAERLDGEACSASALEVHCRMIRARIAAELVRRRLWRPLGFCRLRDYAAERLGASGRSLEEDARVVRALAELPAVRAAFFDGTIRWTHLRLLTSVATRHTEAGWLRLALTTTTRQLAELVKAARRGDGAPGGEEGPDACASADASPATDASSDAGGSHDASASADDRLPDACASADASSRADAPSDAGGSHDASASVDDKLPDACASADASSRAGTSPGANASSDAEAGPAPDVADDDPLVRWNIVTTRTGRKLWRALGELVSRLSGVDVPPSQVAEAVAAEAMSSPLCDPLGPPPPPRGTPRRCSPIEKLGPSEGFSWLAPPKKAQPSSLEHLLVGLPDADAHEIDARLRSAVAAMQRIDARLGPALRAIADRRLHRVLGFSDLGLYAEARLGLCGSKAMALVRIERQCAGKAPLLLEAYRDGRVGWLAASALVPVLGGRPEEQQPWIARACAVTLRRLVADVAWALDRADDDNSSGLPGPPPPLDLDTAADALRRVDLAEVQMRAHAAADLRSFSRRVGARIAVVMPASVATLVEDAIEGCRRAVEPRWRGFERILAHAYLAWFQLPPHENPVFERDTYRCQVPACTRRGPLHAHHVVFRSHGGPDCEWNLTAVCDEHHREFIHRGSIRVHGHAPNGLVWELGCRPGKAPLMRLRGEVYWRE